MDKEHNIKEQFELINSIVSDKSNSFPISYNVLISWSILSALMIIFTPIININFGILPMVIYLFILMGIGLSVDFYYIKKINISRETRTTPNQKFISKVWIINSIFAIILTSIFVENEQFEYIYGVWLFFIGLSNYVTAHIFNKELCNFGIYSIIAAGFLFVSANFIDDKVSMFIVGEILALVFLSGSNLIIGLKLRKLNKNV